MKTTNIDNTRVKVWDLLRPEDVAAAVSAGVDAFGFNLAKGPRKITPGRAAESVDVLPPFALSVALFVDAGVAEIRAAMGISGCQVIQLHGAEPDDVVRELQRDYPVIKALRYVMSSHFVAADHPADAVLLDAYVPGVEGGTGHSWDYRLLDKVAFRAPVILAGGLTPETVGPALTGLQTSVYAVDTASGVESAPGIKDADMMRSFVVAARANG